MLLHAKSVDSFTGTISPTQMPDYYTADEIDDLLLDIITEGGVYQSLELNKTSLTISGGNRVSFENWDTNTANDFSVYMATCKISLKYTIKPKLTS